MLIIVVDHNHIQKTGGVTCFVVNAGHNCRMEANSVQCAEMLSEALLQLQPCHQHHRHPILREFPARTAVPGTYRSAQKPMFPRKAVDTAAAKDVWVIYCSALLAFYAVPVEANKRPPLPTAHFGYVKIAAINSATHRRLWRSIKEMQRAG